MLIVLLIGVAACAPATPAETPLPTPLADPPTAPPPMPTPTPLPEDSPVELDPDPTAPEEAATEEAEALPEATLDLAGNPDLDYAQVQFVTAEQTGQNQWRFDVTVRHNDQGWDHYADAWQVVSPEGEVLGERILAHPHDNEQPFTRSQSGITIPPDLEQVIVRAKCNVHGFGGQQVLVDLSESTGENFEVVR